MTETQIKAFLKILLRNHTGLSYPDGDVSPPEMKYDGKMLATGIHTLLELMEITSQPNNPLDGGVP